MESPRPMPQTLTTGFHSIVCMISVPRRRTGLSTRTRLRIPKMLASTFHFKAPSSIALGADHSLHKQVLREAKKFCKQVHARKLQYGETITNNYLELDLSGYGNKRHKRILYCKSYYFLNIFLLQTILAKLINNRCQSNAITTSFKVITSLEYPRTHSRLNMMSK